MPLGDHLNPVAMTRVAVVAPQGELRSVLVEIAAAGVVELEERSDAEDLVVIEAIQRLEREDPRLKSKSPALLRDPPNVADLESAGRWDLLVGEAQLTRRAGAGLRHRSLVILVGWAPAGRIKELNGRLESLGSTVVELQRPAWLEPPTLLPRPRGSGSFRLLVETYGTSSYEDVDPTPFAAFAFVLMFGMMFGDVGDGLLLILIGVLLRLGRVRRLQSFRRVGGLVLAAGTSAIVFGLLYGEFFGPTHLVEPLWLTPLQQPMALLLGGVVVGAGLLMISYLLGTLNRWREGGMMLALLDSSGAAGLLAFAGVGALVAGIAFRQQPLVISGGALGIAGLVLIYGGLLLRAERGPQGVIEALVGLFDSVIRLGTSSLSFARLAAFGMVHAAIGLVVWNATMSLWRPGPLVLLAVLAFVAGHVVAFLLEALVATVQAMRLEYYELFSRVFAGEGRPFSPWRLPVAPALQEVAT